MSRSPKKKSIPLGGGRRRDQGTVESGEYGRTMTAVMHTFRRLVSVRDGDRQRVGTSGSRLHFRNAIAGRADAFRATLPRGGKRNVVLIMDMSGSMSLEYASDGAPFLEALHRLRRQGALHALLILSGGGYWAEVPHDLDPALLQYTSACHGSESIDQTLNENRQRLLDADTVLVYTDGRITDGRVKAAKWRALGVDLVGCIAETSPRVLADMQGQFSRVICAPDGRTLATNILDYITRRP